MSASTPDSRGESATRARWGAAAAAGTTSAAAARIPTKMRAARISPNIGFESPAHIGRKEDFYDPGVPRFQVVKNGHERRHEPSHPSPTGRDAAGRARRP